MASDQVPGNFDERIAWLEEDDAKSRNLRARRLQEILATMPVPSEGFQFLNGGEESMTCFHEVRRCYLDGSYMAVVLLSLLYVERELAGLLYAGGWNPAGNARLDSLLDEAHDRGVLSKLDLQVFRELAKTRNSYAHFRPPGTPTSLMARSLERRDLPNEVIAKDARRALEAMWRLVQRSGGPFLSGE